LHDLTIGPTDVATTCWICSSFRQPFDTKGQYKMAWRVARMARGAVR
jgi:hypothetical protein